MTDAPRWTFDKLGRWRSPEFRRWVRTLPCSCGEQRCPRCTPWTLPPGAAGWPVVCAHWRFGAAVGVGAKPDDLLVHPVADAVHARWHATGHPSPELQAAAVSSTLELALRRRVLVARGPLPELPLPTRPVQVEHELRRWRECFAAGVLELADTFYQKIPF